MGKRVYTLKHATPRMKYQHMRNMMEWQADLKEKQEVEADRRATELQDCFFQVRDELKELDPAGWSQWYDEFVPDWKGWLNAQPAIDCITKRVAELRAAAVAVTTATVPSEFTLEPTPTPTTKTKNDQLQWRVASASTLRNYATAVKDFEAVTNTKAEQASFSTLRQWHDSMIGRKYAQNTIRARISVVRLMSHNTSYPLPPKIKYPNTLLSLKQVRAVLAQAKKPGEREALMKSLSGFDAISKRTHTNESLTEFDAHFLGIEVAPTSSQALTRLLKRFAKKAGIDQTVSLRIWAQTGAYLLKVLSPVEFSFLMPKLETETPLKNAKPLHGIGRRSHTLKV